MRGLPFVWISGKVILSVFLKRFQGAKFFNDAFLGPKSYYLRMFIYFFSICVGYKVYNSSYQHQAYVSLLNDFQGPNALPGPIQQMLENNDYRYARELLQTAEVAAEKKEWRKK